VVVGTVAYRDPHLLEVALSRLGNRLVASIDARGDQLAASGWTEQTGMAIDEVLKRLGERGVRRFVYSSIERDGMLAGPDLDAARRVARAMPGTFVYSGGISSLEDLRALAGLRAGTLTGVIVGKALYEGRFTVEEGQTALDG
jgi:phosphoribosylformimino-5-aminoimidazole carboxamide ribotide isomerase